MNKLYSSSALSVLLLALTGRWPESNAFTVPNSMNVAFKNAVGSGTQVKNPIRTLLVQRQMTSPDKQAAQDSDIERLKTMAAKLRAEAAALEAQKAEELAMVAEKAFKQFDTNKDGEVSVAELKAGLEKILKTELPEKRVQELMNTFDSSGDGKLQMDEFVGIDQFRNKLEALAREEKRLAAEAKKRAKQEEDQAAFVVAQIEVLNERPPTTSEKFISVLPYLFPLMDSLVYGRFLLVSVEDGNPLFTALAALYVLYRSIPFSGFIAFLSLSFLSGNPSINRLIRFNMQQAIFLDIALFFPSLASGLIGLILLGLNKQIPDDIVIASTSAIFVVALAAILYCMGSSLLGKTPDKLPLISDAVNSRMPTVDMFDAQGNFSIEKFREKMSQDSQKKDEKKDDKDKKN